MQIIGHKLIEYKNFNLIQTVENILNFDNLIFEYNEDFIKNAKDNGKTFSVIARNLNEAILANALKAKFIIIEKNNISIAKEVVKLAEFYLFDSKIAIIIENYEKDLLNAINLKVDAVIYKNIINYII
ncbi:hypothetical protein CYJ41_03280 [Campylobacter ureolyticus]|uniref:Uncharacterized protein n=1 Tax=Campylobacter ureolyticus TaxID=827 RepID=A0A2I1NAK7_9BACT|nr:hypothetical protein [Campylobacter ureolyticus]MCR8699490.1 hypothetical protein [Campylobacter ureolyticus]MCZ6134322.1 hypothetical protein [Campylobacter ureolyticus]MCZ6155646.1 hypothetical protein [Campylobacter ureolyticus]MCZ6161365.1 hypothetical protein [Campylobacter ureolyticus]MCZ6170351.1 hypothetical protein [Campylobacter ureolyticus]